MINPVSLPAFYCMFFFYFSTIYTPGLRLTFSTCLNERAIRQLQCQVEEHSSEYPQSLELLGLCKSGLFHARRALKPNFY